MSFKKDFMWGAATSAYQIEGGTRDDGKGSDIWEMFSKRPGSVYDGGSGDVSCDHYHRYKEDVKLMAELGLKYYRFSINWSRILPDGTGKVNQKGIDFYNNLIDELLKYGIKPFVTLYHWELPTALHRKGGWLNRDIADWFADYARIIAENFSDRVKYFCTINEPLCVAGLGYAKGIHAPGLKMDNYDCFAIVHNLLRAHGKAVDALRTYGKQPLKIGIVTCSGFTYPQNPDNPADVEAARKKMFAAFPEDSPVKFFSLGLYTDPVYLGKYPDDVIKLYGELLPDNYENDMKEICRPVDFAGHNIYFGHCVAADGEMGFKEIKPSVSKPRSAYRGWYVTPEAMYWGIKFLYERYNLPVIMTENGISLNDVVCLDGKVHDPERIDYVQRYLRAIKRCEDEGIQVDGYFYWSFMDNFEWGEGYSQRFGLVYVDYDTQERIVKDSAYWYKQVISSNGDII